MNFVIWAPDYSESSGGAIALHKLAHNISLLGEKSFIFTGQKNENYLGEKVDFNTAVFLSENGVVVYPEIVKGNPLFAKNVVRWLLNTPGVIRHTYGDGCDGDNDRYYKYNQLFKAKDESKVVGILRAVELNLGTFRNFNQGARYGGAYLIKNGKNRQWHEDKFTNIEGHSNRFIANIFNRVAVFISYDNATYHSVQAALCGCISIVVPNGNMSAEEWKSKFPLCKYGVAYGLGDIPNAIKTINLVTENLIKIELESIEQTKVFIKDCYSFLSAEKT